MVPPVNAFWSLTIYELPASLHYANPLNRHLSRAGANPTSFRSRCTSATISGGHRVVIGGDIVGFTGGQNDPRSELRARWRAGGFCSKTRPASGREPGPSPPCTGGAVVRPDDGAVDHLQGVRLTAAIGEGLQQHIP